MQDHSFIKKYYGRNGTYLAEHARYFQSVNTGDEIQFLSKTLRLNKKDSILDIACGQGRHAFYLAKQGFRVDGVDFSNHLIEAAKQNTVALEQKPDFFVQNVMQLRLQKKYSKAYWFFADLAGITVAKALTSINTVMEEGGMVLVDTDNIFRIISYLMKNPRSHLRFDAASLELIDTKNHILVPYPTVPIWKQWIEASHFSLQTIFGDYAGNTYSLHSPRLILIVKKNAQALRLGR